ncbi:hypothetical protein BGZ99_006515 [Dissophora globulifera]|uniref:Structure-specific endonuclease subunit SLX4 n=1 Tax=Dissophora globulifera TaxID=979702 RepID=A0A9P6USA6_9FUNG|nr:hypothetical protein BGZ99_006515 [Dissophora globulifera]
MSNHAREDDGDDDFAALLRQHHASPTPPTPSRKTGSSSAFSLKRPAYKSISESQQRPAESHSAPPPSIHDAFQDVPEERIDLAECLICGKVLLHLDPARIEYHVNNCMDEQMEQFPREGHASAAQTTRSSSSSSRSSTPTSRISSKRDEYAGAQVDYLTMIRTCPICKLDWPLSNTHQGAKGNAASRGTTGMTSGSGAQSRTARQKVEHMKRCAKENKRTVQSLVYQIRLLRERYERSMTLGTPMDASQRDNPSQDMDKDEFMDSEPADDDEEPREPEVNESDYAVVSVGSHTPTRVSKTAIKQVVSLAETADGDFISDAIITTVHAPTPSRPPRLSRLQQLGQDQQDESLQLALAISRSESESYFGSDLDFPGDGSATPMTWTMAPSLRKGNKRRKRTEQERSETTIRPMAEVQQLIQANVGALLFPELEDASSPTASDDESGGLDGRNNGPVKTPPWRPSRFAGLSRADLQVGSSQTSEPDDAPSSQQSLWDLSQHRDIHDVEHLDLDADGQHGDRTTDTGEPDDDVQRRQRRRINVDADNYVSQFMRQYTNRNSFGEGSMQSRAEPVPKESAVLDNASDTIPRQQRQDNEFTSPLWSTTKARTIPFIKHKELIQQAFEKSLKSEIVSHLETMARQVQQAKLDAYHKIIGSLLRHPVAAGLVQQEPADVDLVDDEADLDDMDEAQQDLDNYEEPSSPLLRFSKRTEPPWSETDDLYSLLYDDASFTNRLPSPVLPTAGGHIQSEGPIVVESDTSFQEERPSEPGYDDNDGQTNAILVYSPSASDLASASASQQNNPADHNTIDLDLIPSPIASFQSDDTPDSLRRISSSSCELPPPLDFIKLGYHNAASLSAPPLRSPTRDSYQRQSPASEGGRHADDDGGPFSDSAWTESRWIGATTPKSNSRVRDAVGDMAGGSMRAPPGRPRSAVKIRTGLPVPLSAPSSPTIPPTQPTSKRDPLHGLPLRKPLQDPSQPSLTGSKPTANTTVESDDDFDFEKQSAVSRSQRSVSPLHAASPGPETSVQNPRTPSRGSNNRRPPPMASQSAVTPFRSSTIPGEIDPQSLALTGADIRRPAAPRTTPSSKIRSQRRAEALAAESAKMVARITSLRRRPDYENMSVPRLRLEAATFGLKAVKKAVLVEQLTTIWERLNPHAPASASEDGGEQAHGNAEEDELEVIRRVRDIDYGGHHIDGDAAVDTFYEDDGILYSVDSSDPLGSEQVGGTSIDDALDLDLDLDSLPQHAGVSISRAGIMTFGTPHSYSESDAQDIVDIDSDGDQTDVTEEYLGSEDPLISPIHLELEDDALPSEHDPVVTTASLEHRLFHFLENNAHFRKQYLTYKPLDVEELWEACQAAGIVCNRKEVRHFLDNQGIVCIVPAHSTLAGSWRKQAKKRKLAHRP